MSAYIVPNLPVLANVAKYAPKARPGAREKADSH